MVFISFTRLVKAFILYNPFQCSYLFCDVTGLVSRAIGGKIPGGFNISSAKSHLPKTWGLGPQCADTVLLIATSVGGGYDSPFSFHPPALVNQPVISRKQPFSEIDDDGHERLSSSAGGSASQPQGSISQTLRHGTLQRHRCGSHHSTIFTPFQQHSRASQAQGPPRAQTQPRRASLHSQSHPVLPDQDGWLEVAWLPEQAKCHINI